MRFPRDLRMKGNIMQKETKLKESVRFIPSILVFLSGILFLFSAFTIAKSSPAETTDIPANTEKEVQEIYIEKAEYYVIKENEDGKISVYLSDGSKFTDTEIFVFSLSEKDRELLSVGIMAKSDEELSLYLEGLSG